MYLRKGRRNVDNGDVLVNIDRSETSHENTGEFSPLPAGGARRPIHWTSQNTNSKSSENKENFQLDELPDGACIAPVRLVQKDTECTAVREASYIGSFSVLGNDQATRAEYVRQQLVDMRNVTRCKPILLVISLSGIKICSSNGESVYMAHALKRISYATCDPEFCQFSFLAREPKSQLNSQYCHAFVTATPEQAEDLNVLVGNAFKMAYAQQRQKHPSAPSFNQIIEAQIQEQKARNEVECEQTKKEAQKDLSKRLSLISTSSASDLAQQRKEIRRQQSEEIALEKERQRIVGKDKIWAKQAAQRTKHRPGLCDSPGLKQDFETNFPVRQSGSPVVSLKETLDNQDPSSELMQRFTSQYRPDSPLTRSESPVQNGRNSPGRNSPISPLSELRGSPKRTLNSSPRLKRRDRKRKESSDNGETSRGESRQSPLVVSDSTGTPDSPMDADSYLMPLKNRQTPESDNSPVSSSSPKPCRRTSGPELSRRPLPAVPCDTVIDQSADRTLTDIDQSEARRRISPDIEDQLDEGICKGPRDRRMSTDSGRSFSPASNRSPSNDSPSQDLSYNEDFSLSRRIDSDFSTSVDQLGPPPPLPLRLDSLRRYDPGSGPLDDTSLQQASWYQAGIPREIALEILSQEDIGSFIVRDSTTHPHCYALSVRVPKFENPTGISHYLIKQTHRGGYMLKGLDKEWPSLTSLVTHHTVMQEKLPCTLRLPRNSQNPAYHDVEPDDTNDKDDDDEDYQRLSDFTSMMADLKMEK